jgi:hypothetical protein
VPLCIEARQNTGRPGQFEPPNFLKTAGRHAGSVFNAAQMGCRRCCCGRGDPCSRASPRRRRGTASRLPGRASAGTRDSGAKSSFDRGLKRLRYRPGWRFFGRTRGIFCGSRRLPHLARDLFWDHAGGGSVGRAPVGVVSHLTAFCSRPRLRRSRRRCWQERRR